MSKNNRSFLFEPFNAYIRRQHLTKRLFLTRKKFRKIVNFVQVIRRKLFETYYY